MRYLFTFFTLLFFAGCAQKMVYESSQAYFIVIKNAKIALADTGFIKQNQSEINLQIFSAATPVFNLHVRDDVCMDLLCVSREKFNQEFFGTAHYNSFLEEILTAQPIYNKQNMRATEDGFMQHIQNGEYDITYRVDAKTLYFKDSKNHILIKLRKLQ